MDSPTKQWVDIKTDLLTHTSAVPAAPHIHTEVTQRYSKPENNNVTNRTEPILPKAISSLQNRHLYLLPPLPQAESHAP
jgi:hypothetical protein